MSLLIPSPPHPSPPHPLTPSSPHPLTPSSPHPIIPSPPHPLTSSPSHPLIPSPPHPLTSHSFLRSTRTCSTNMMPSRHSLKKTKRNVNKRCQRCVRYRLWITRPRHTWKKHSGSLLRRKMRRLMSCRCRWVEQKAGPLPGGWARQGLVPSLSSVVLKLEVVHPLGF